MIQVNLLPDVKQVFIKAQRTKHMVIGGALTVSVVAILFAIILALQVYVNQPLHTKGLQADIDKGIAELQAIEDLDTVLTVNQQLQSLPGLHDQKPSASRISGLLAKLVPSSIDLSELDIDFAVAELGLRGQATDTKAVNTFADILKNATYAVDGATETKKVFSGVEFTIGVPTVDGVLFDAEMNYDALIFDNSFTSVTFAVPSIISTQSSIRSSSLFELPSQELE